MCLYPGVIVSPRGPQGKARVGQPIGLPPSEISRVSDDFAEIDLAFGELSLGNDSADENGQFDPAQAKQITIGDISAMAGNPVPVNTLWIDNVLFME